MPAFMCDLFVVNNLYFILVIFAAIVVAYFLSNVTNAFSIYLEEKKSGILWIVDVLSAPLLLFILNVGYGVGHFYLTIPGISHASLEHAVNVLLILNLCIAIYKIVPTALLKICRVINPFLYRSVKFFVVIASIGIVVAVFYKFYAAIVTSVILTCIFYIIADRLLFMPKPSVVPRRAIPKRMVLIHIYISTKETHDAVIRAINLIKEAISEIEGTGENNRVSLSGFKPGAFDIAVQYDVMQPELLEQIKEKVNLNIIKKLSDAHVQLSGHMDF